MFIVERNITLVELGGSLACGYHGFPFLFSCSHVDEDADANVDVGVDIDVCSSFFGCVEEFSDFVGQ